MSWGGWIGIMFCHCPMFIIIICCCCCGDIIWSCVLLAPGTGMLPMHMPPVPVPMPMLPGAIPPCICCSLLLPSVEFQWFLMALSVRPGRSLAISAQRFCRVECASMRSRSSSDDHLSFLTLGSSWLCHRSRICLPVRPGRCTARADQDLRPCFSTSLMTISSSSLFQGHLVTLPPLCDTLESPPSLVLEGETERSMEPERELTALAAETSSGILSSSPSSTMSSWLSRLTVAMSVLVHASSTGCTPSWLARRMSDGMRASETDSPPP
mmetsp:Transcript_8745/g.22774  ORF Transcript_8745/g.22774 Transcript_8745/m.22774 type:complete len:268 (-) Transcript_8745:631-1434(-)